MIKIAILGDIGSGKSFIAKQFGYPVFNADNEVKKIYSKDISCYKKLKRVLPKHIVSFPINKKEIIKSILSNQNNLKKIIKIVHPRVRIKMNKFINNNKKKKLIIFDVPLLLENKMEKKANILIFVEARKKEIIKNLKRRKNYNPQILKILKKLQLSLYYKKKKSNFVIKNNFKIHPTKNDVKLLKKKLLNK